MLDAMALQSSRAAEIYATLGGPEPGMRELQFSLKHIEHIAPETSDAPPTPVRFARLAGAASVPKGSEVFLGALRILEQETGLADRFKLTVLGFVHNDTREALAGLLSAEWGGFSEPESL